MHGDVPAAIGPFERGDRGLALEKALGQQIDHPLGGLLIADRKMAREVAGVRVEVIEESLRRDLP